MRAKARAVAQHRTGAGVALQPGPARPISRSRLKKRSQSLRALSLRYRCCPGFLRVRLDHGERLGQEEHGHDDALFVLTELASCRRQACE